MINYLSQIRERTGFAPVRVRVGGNSGDISNYVPTQTTSVILTDPNARVHNQPANYGPVLWDIMQKASELAGGVNYLIGAAEHAFRLCSLVLNSYNRSDTR